MLQYINPNSLYLSPTDEAEIQHTINNLKPKNRIGIDKISSNFLKQIYQNAWLPLNCHGYTQLIHETYEKKENGIGLFLDLPEAFDTINHSNLLKKLEWYGTVQAVMITGNECLQFFAVLSLPHTIITAVKLEV